MTYYYCYSRPLFPSQDNDFLVGIGIGSAENSSGLGKYYILLPTLPVYCQGPFLIIMTLIYRNINNATVTPGIYGRINLSEIGTHEHSSVKPNCEHTHESDSLRQTPHVVVGAPSHDFGSRGSVRCRW